jgi:hypothetical protein
MVMAALFILARASWAAVDQADPGKVLAMEVFQTVNTRMPWAPPNGSRVQAATHRVWTRIVRRNASTDRESGLN